MPGVRWRGFIYAFLILGVPGIVVLVSYEGGLPGPEQMLSLALLVVLISGFCAQYFANRAILSPEELIIRKDHQDFHVRLYDIEEAFIADSLEEVDAVTLPEGHFPMEFETHDRSIIVLVLRDNTVSLSTSERYNGVVTKVVSFNVSKPDLLLSYLRMRI